MNRSALHALVASLSFGAPGLAQPDVENRLKALEAKHPSLVRVGTIGSSRQGRALHVAWLTDRGEEPGPGNAMEDRPALLIIAGANGMHRVGVETALSVAERIAGEHAAALQSVSVYVIPMLNPDSFAFHAEPGRPRTDFARTIRPTDADRDGRTDEDPPEDLNGDGVISTMRIADPPPGSAWPATHTADPENPRLVKTPDAAKGESARFAVLIEGTDNDGDGRFNEDGPGGSGGGGVELDWNTPYRWKEWGDGIGRYQLSEPESLALVTWMLGHKNIAGVLVFGPHDTLVKVPEAGKFDDSGQVPLGLENDDKPYYEEISKAFKEITKITGAPSVDNAGSIHAWSYAHFGVWTFATPVWVRPDLIKADEPKKDGDPKEGDQKEGKKEGDAKPEEPPTGDPPAGNGAIATAPAAQPAGGGGRRSGGRPPGAGPPAGGADQDAQKKAAESDDAKWLKYSDEKRDKAGFLDWQPFDHPQLGKVEIGGFVPGFRLNPPDDELPRLVEEQTKFVAALLGKLPKVSLDAPAVERAGANLWRITARATNSGYFPTMPAIGVKARRAMPTLVSIDVPMERIVSGSRTGRLWAIPGSGGSAEHEWMIVGDPGSTVAITFAPTFGGEQSMTITLQEAAR